MSVANKKRLSRVKGINWKKVILWTFNIVCYIITFIFAISLIIGSVKDSNVSNQQSTNSAIDINATQQYGLVVDEGSITLSGGEIHQRYYSTINVYNPSVVDSSYCFSSIVIHFNFTSYSLIIDEAYFEYSDSGHFVFQYYDSDSYHDYYFSYYFYSSQLPQVLVAGIYSGYYLFDDFIEVDGARYLVSSIECHYIGLSNVYDSIYTFYYGNPNEDIFDTIGDTIPSFVSTLNSGLTEAVTIFYDDGLTTIGYLSAIVVAVVLGYFSLRVVMGLIRLRG